MLCSAVFSAAINAENSSQWNHKINVKKRKVFGENVDAMLDNRN